MEKRLTQLKTQMLDYHIPLEDHPITAIHSQHADVLEAARAELEPLEQELVTSVQFLRENRAAIAKLTERRQVLNAVRGGMIADVMRRSAGGSASMQGGDDLSGAVSDDEGDEKKVDVAGDSDTLHIRNVLVGTIATDQQMMFSRMLYRVSRGNAFARFKEIKLPHDVRAGEGDGNDEEEPEEKSVFYAVILGQQITARVMRMCEAFKVNLYQVPEGGAEIKAQVERIKADLKDKRDVEARTENSVSALLARLGSSDETGTTPLRDWQVALAVERQIATTLMKAHFYLTMISLEGWVPATELNAIKQACKAAVSGTGNPPAAIEVDPANPIRIPDQPPTYFRLNKFTETFQGIVDTYGVPRYKEANPGLFTIISFPFLFGVMYGDIGHGIALTLFAFILVYKEDAIAALQKRGQLGEIPSMAFGGRYVLLLMGMFAVYCGMIYNDCLSIPLNAWGSNYYDDGTNSTYLAFTTNVYPIGVDPSWAHKANSLAFANSMKMKMAVTLGVTQMLFGIILSLSNHLYFRDMLSVYFEFIPRMIFMLSTFGYMVFMILYKWCVDWSAPGMNPPPNLIQTMISMFLAPGSVDPAKQLYAGQAGFQAFLLLCALFSVPVLLFAKPYAHKRLHAKKAQAYHYAGPADPQLTHEADDDDEDEEKRLPSTITSSEQEHLDVAAADDDLHAEFSFSDEMIHNAIHTIEFVLGCVSNTASYLRLWALSLAHAQLAEVFWDKMIQQYGINNNGFMAFAGFAVWFGATFAVLLCMDVLECFLHALRLHWVEFQNKCQHTTQHHPTRHIANLHPAPSQRPHLVPSVLCFFCSLLRRRQSVRALRVREHRPAVPVEGRECRGTRPAARWMQAGVVWSKTPPTAAPRAARRIGTDARSCDVPEQQISRYLPTSFAALHLVEDGGGGTGRSGWC